MCRGYLRRIFTFHATIVLVNNRFLNNAVQRIQYRVEGSLSVRVLFLEWRLGARLCLQPFLRFFQYFPVFLFFSYVGTMARPLAQMPLATCHAAVYNVFCARYQVPLCLWRYKRFITLFSRLQFVVPINLV